ncbi:autotransporter outer membrane beta-barrel domain-containing protein [Megasphaera massiliensis]|uniref:autotransporter outer membrane beta-barrel domain-containing protein n=3 Tax=Megasphaera TaxID=906 RepID=UPI003AF8BB78
MTNENPTNILRLQNGSKATVSAGRDLLFSQTQTDSSVTLGAEINTQLEVAAGNDIIFNNEGQRNIIYSNQSQVSVEAGHDIIYNHKHPGGFPVNYFASGTEASIRAGHDLIMDSVRSTNLFNVLDKSSVKVAADNDVFFHVENLSSITNVASSSNSSFSLKSRDFISNAQRTLRTYDDSQIDIHVNRDIKFITPGIDVGTSMIQAFRNGIANVMADRDMILAINVAAPNVQVASEGGGANLTAGRDMILSTVGKDGGNPLESNLYADNGTITAKVIDGTLSISNDGAVGAYADNGGSITLEGPVVMDVGTGAAAANDGTILFKGPLTLHSTDTVLRAVDGGVIHADAADTEKYIDGNIVAQGGTVSIDLNKVGSYLTGTTSVSDGTASERAAVADSRTGTLNLTLGNGTVWNVTGDSSLTNLTNNGVVNMTDSSRTGQEVTAKTLSGTGTLAMDLDWLSNQGTKGATANSDYLKVTDSATGTQALVSDPTVMNLDKMAVNDRLYVAELNNSDAVLTSSIQQRNVNKGHLYDYLIGLTHETTGDTTDWYFGSVGTVESNVVPAAAVQNRTLFDLATNMDTLNKRLGEARYADGEDSGMWARWTYRHLGRDSYDGHSNRFELGFDGVDQRDDGSTLRQGLSFSYLKSQTSFDEGNGKYKGYTGSFYRTWLGQKGHYLDVVGRIGKINGEGTTRLFDGDESKSSFGTWYQQASVEWGRKKALNNRWYIEPQSQLQYTHINGYDFRTNDGVGHDFDSVHSFIGRLGFRLGKDLDAHTSWYFKADILHEFAGNRTFDLSSVDGLERLRFDKTDHDTWYDVGAGITAELSHDRSLWFEFERTFNGSYGRDWELNAGMTWRFH